MSNHCIYFIKPVGRIGPIKIGCSHLPDSRLLALARWSPLPLEIVTTTPGGMSQEKDLHERFADSRLHFEWFDATPELLDLIERLKRGERLPAEGLHERRVHRILELQDSGLSAKEIAPEIGVSEARIKQIIWREMRVQKARAA